MIRVAIINVPIPAPWMGPDCWITVPPQGYGGIQWVVANLMDGLINKGHQVLLLGAPGSPRRSGLDVIDAAGTSGEIRCWLEGNRDRYDVVHDHSNGDVFSEVPTMGFPYVATYHLTGTPKLPVNVVYLSRAQRAAAGAISSPVIPIPVAAHRYPTRLRKQDYLLFLGRVSPWKGTVEAARFASAVGMRLRIAGPCWEEGYRRRVEVECPVETEWLGEVGGADRVELLGDARAVIVLSQSVPGPWGHQWVEPGATVVSEAAASGTPVIASNNGCLPEIVPGVGVILDENDWTPDSCKVALAALPSPEVVSRLALERWGHVQIAERYVQLYTRAMGGETW